MKSNLFTELILGLVFIAALYVATFGTIFNIFTFWMKVFWWIVFVLISVIIHLYIQFKVREQNERSN